MFHVKHSPRFMPGKLNMNVSRETIPNNVIMAYIEEVFNSLDGYNKRLIFTDKHF